MRVLLHSRDHCAITVHSSFVATWWLGTHANYRLSSGYPETVSGLFFEDIIYYLLFLFNFY